MLVSFVLDTAGYDFDVSKMLLKLKRVLCRKMLSVA